MFAGIALVLIVIAWLRYEREPAPEAPAAAEPAAVAEPEGPRHPVRPPIDAEPSASERLVPLPPLADSDRFFSLELGNVLGDTLEAQLADEAIIEKVVATVDNLPRDKLSERLRPIGKVPGDFTAAETADPERFAWSPENDARYDALVTLFTSASTADILDLYRRFYPLFQEAYVNLGYPDGYFNDRVIEVIDHLLETPEPGGSPGLVRPHVLYQYADPALESLSSGRKALLRMGSEHRAAVKAKLRELRSALADTGAPAVDEPLVDEPLDDQPVVDQPLVDQPGVD